MENIKKGLLAVAAVLAGLMCMGGIFSLTMLLRYADFKQGKAIIIVIFLLMIAGFGVLSFKCFKSVFRKKGMPKSEKVVNFTVEEQIPDFIEERYVQSVDETPENPVVEKETENNTIFGVPVEEIKIMPREEPQEASQFDKTGYETVSVAPVAKTNVMYGESLNSMRMLYTEQQITNDIRIIDESLAIMQETSDIDTFLSRHELAMRHVLILEQAKKAGIPITLQDGFSQSLMDIKSEALADVLCRSFKKELNEIRKLKTERGQLNRINKYQEKLRGMYEDVFEFTAEDAYNDVMQKLEDMKGE